jgi:ubiquinone/menaquinone biosynthesis C-methylase UbiE
MASNAVDIQRAYYAATADRYDAMHVNGDDEHSFALRFLIPAVRHLGIRSILDIGSGTGRGILTIKAAMPRISTLVGIEPSQELRHIGYSKGLSKSELIDGDAMNLTFGDGSFDVVCEFGALHHIPDPSKAVSEMLRVARRAVFISDSNNFGQGSWIVRTIKQAINAAHLWNVANFIKTNGKRYTISEGDGVAYSYSVFSDYEQICKTCESVYIVNTSNAGPNLYRTAPHVALLGVKSCQNK